MSVVKLHTKDWAIEPIAAAAVERRAGTPESLPAEFLTSKSKIAAQFRATPTTPSPGRLDFSAQIGKNERAVVVIRHPSGALTFHAPERGARFAADARRGGGQQAITAIVVKVAGTALKQALPKLAQAAEKQIFKSKGLAEGWFRVEAAGEGVRLISEVPSSRERTLLLLHGAFSDAAASFGKLAARGLLDRVRPLYGGRVYAFNHFTVSRTPEENARMLAAALPHAIDFDAVTHSRGGLVLRSVSSSNFRLHRAVLVACPNEGTPLATPARWQQTIGWIANLLELFPDHLFSTAAGFVANALVWLAWRVMGELPGIAAMDRDGPQIAALKAAPVPADVYSALVSNYRPQGNVLARMADCGVDQFFGSANDLVVPSEGGWRVGGQVPGNRIACYGAGGNLADESVTHTGFFSHIESCDVIVDALSGIPSPLAPIDPALPLPDSRVLRAATETPQASREIGPPRAPEMLPPAVVPAGNTLHLLVLPGPNADRHGAQIFAQYGSARVLEDFNLGGGRWQSIIANQRSIKNYVDGKKGGMPDDATLRQFGEMLFETLFPARVRRLYDTARSLESRERRLNLILTSTISWVADLPWEFCYDPVRKTFLATEEMHFLRNVMTAVPAELIDDHDRLRILVVSSQPVGMGKLAVSEEEAVIKRGFEPLVAAGLADVDVLARATPASLHGHVSTGRYSVVHFIGHGEYDKADDRGYLIFQDERGNPYRVGDAAIRQILCNRALRLVFLNACETGQGGHADFNRGIAPALVAGGVPIVVANQYKVLDLTATAFARHFYWSLAHGLSVGESARESRIAVNYSIDGESIDWAVPVVYARDPNSRLCPPRAFDPATASPATPQPDFTRRARRAMRVGVWDVHAQFPGLCSTLDRMNAAQDFYRFEPADLSVPLDSWYVTGRTRYLNAERFAARIAPQIRLAGVHAIIAIVAQPMARGVTPTTAQTGISEWWPPPGKPIVLVSSTAGLDLAPAGAETERVIANTAAAALACYLRNAAGHARGSANCPNRRSRRASARAFCAACAEELRAAHPAEFRALARVLNAV